MAIRERGLYRSVLRCAIPLFVHVLITLFSATDAHAQYNNRFSTISSGAITFTGNTLGLDGDDDENGQGTRGAIGTFITTDQSSRDTNPPPNNDPFPFGTTSDWRLNRSAATLRIPAGARVLHAELVWGGTFAGEDDDDDVSDFIDDAITFTTPNGTFDVDPDPTTGKESGSTRSNGECESSSGCFYVRSANVTAQVRAVGAGVYTVGGVPATQGHRDNNNPSAGWTLAVVYEDFTKPIRSLTLFQGMERSGGAAASVSGFCTPLSGPLSGRLAVSAMEGDARIDGDRMLFGPTSNLDDDDDRIEGPRNPRSNFFSGQITDDDGDLDESGTFGDRNHSPDNPRDGARQGWDITNVDVSERLRNDQTQAFAQGTTDGDNYRITTLALQIDVGAPRFVDALSKSVDRETATIGDVLTYTVVVHNSSTTTPALNTIFFDTPPPGTSFVPGSFTVDGVARPGADPEAGVAIGDVATGDEVEIEFQVTVDSIPPGPDPHLRSNTARWEFEFISCAGEPARSGAAESNTVVTEVPVADLLITKSFASPVVLAGDTVTYQVVVSNDGPSNVSGAIVADPGTTPALTGVTWTCVPNPGASSCSPSFGSGALSSVVNLAIGSGVTFTVRGTLPANTPPGTLTNTASIASPPGVPELNPANNSVSVNVPILARANLRLTKRGASPTTSLGGTITYTIEVTNDGPSVAAGVVVSDPAPTGLTVDTPLSGACTAAPGCTLAPGDSETLTITFGVPTDYSGPDPIRNTATVTADTPGERSSAGAHTALVAPVADLSITKTNGGTELAAGSTTTYAIVVTNLGTSSAPGTQVTDVFDPVIFSGVEWTCTPSGTSTCAVSGTQTGNISTTIDIDAGAGNAVTFTAQAVVRPTATGEVTNAATVEVATGITDPDSSNNSATDEDAIAASADIAVTNDGPAQIAAGELVTYTVTVTNNGPSTADNVPASFRLRDAGGGEQHSWILGVVSPPPGVTCQRVDFGSGTLLPTCTIPTLAPGATVTLTAQVQIPPDYAPPLPATISAEAFTSPTVIPDPVSANNSETVVSPFAIEADLSITKTGLTTTLENRPFSYFLHVVNNGPATATNVVINDVLPAGVTVLAIDGFCTSFPCTVPSAPPGSATDIRVDVVVPPGFSGSSFVNTATVTSDATDPDTSNNSSSVTTLVVTERTDIALTKTGSTSVAPGGTIEYDITVTVRGVGAARDVDTIDILPAGTTFASITPPAGASCTTPAVGEHGTITCRTAFLEPLEEIAFHVTLTADDTLQAGTVLSNVAVVTSAVPDFNTANDRARVDTLVADETDADLAITIDDAPDPVVAGSSVTLTLTVRNLGPATANAVSVAGALPAGLTLVTATPSQGSCTTATCDLGVLNAGDMATIDIVATAAAAGVHTTTATVSATENDPVAANDSATETTTVASTADEADVAIEKGAARQAVPGETDTFLIRVTNRGPGEALLVTVDDVLPPEFEFVSNNLDCVGGFPCHFDAIAPGQTLTIATTVRVLAGTPTPTTVSNSATATSVSIDPDLTNNTSTAESTINADASADVEVVKIDSTDAVVAGTALVYSVLVANRGPDAAEDVVLTDTLPAGVTLVSTETTRGSCTGTTTITCNIGTLAGGTGAIITIAVEAPTAVPTPNPMVNTATVTASTPDPVAANNTATAETTVSAGVADLSITKSGPATATAGGPVAWTIVVSNAGPSDLIDIPVEDLVPPSVTAVSWTCTASSGSACDAASGTGSIATTVDLEVGGTATFTLTGTVAPGATGTISNTATVSAPMGATDPDPANNSAASLVTVTTSADVSVAKTGPATAFAGSVITYTITVSNAGPSTATNVAVADVTPTGLTFVANTGDCTTAFPCALGAIAPGETRTITARYNAPAGMTPGTDVVNTATVTTDTTDPASANNTSSITTRIAAPQTDLTITKTATSSAAPGGSITYTLLVRNNGPVEATAVTTTDALPGGTTFASLTAPALTTCTTPAAGMRGLISCTTPTLLPGVEIPISIVADVADDVALGTTLANTATVSSTVADLNAANNRATANTIVAAATDADLLITIDDAPDPVEVGTDVTLTITVTNQGPAAATDVTATRTLPAALSFVSATPSQGACPAATCALGTLAAGASATIEITATATTSGLFTTTATTSATENDPVTANNTATEETTAATATEADVLVELIGPATLAPGQTAAYQTRVTNRGLASALNVSLDLPVNAPFLFDGNSGDCTTAFPCTFAAIPVGETRTIVTTFTVDAGATVPGTVPATATATSATPDPNPANNSATVSTELVASGSADLEITKTGSPTTAIAGTVVTYTLTVINHGATLAAAVTVSDVLPTGLTLVSASASQGTCSGTTTVSCALGDLGFGRSAVVTIEAQTPATIPAPNPMVNTATVTSSTTDPDSANNSATASITVALAADVSVVKAGPTSIAAGQQLTYTITVTNDGPSTATGVVLEDPVPAGLVAGTVSGDCTLLPCLIGTLQPGDTRTADVTMIVPSGYMTPNPIVNTATVSATTPDPDAANNSSSSSAAVTVVADVAVTIDGPATVIRGDDVVYTVTVTNAGPSDAVPVMVDVPTPTGLTFVSNTGGCTTVFPCSFVSLAAAATQTITVTYTVPAGYTTPDPITVTATASTVTNDPDTVNNTATAQTALNLDADVEVTTDLPASADVGDTIEITVTAINHGPNPVTDVIVTSLVPGGLQFVSAMPEQGTYDDTTGEWEVGTLAVGESTELALTVTILEAGEIATVAVKTGQSEPDPDTSNDSAADVVNGEALADVSVTKTVDVDTADVGDTVTFVVTATNRGPGPATGVSVSDALPAGLSLVSATPSRGTYATGTWTIGIMTSGASATLTVVATVTAPGAIVNQAVISAQTPLDPNPLNNSSAVSVNASPTDADLRVSKTLSALTPDIGVQITYTVAVTNLGPGDASGVVIEDQLPAGLLFVSAVASHGSYDETTGLWTVGDIPATGTALLAITARVTQTGTIVNTASRESSVSIDPNPANDSASVTIESRRFSDLNVTKTPSTPSSTPGSTLAWTIVVSNAGPSSTLARFRDTVPAGLDGATWTCVASAGATCSAASGTGSIDTAIDIEVGSTVTFVMTGTVNASATTAIVNTASVVATAAEPRTGNNSATSLVSLPPPPAPEPAPGPGPGPAPGPSPDVLPPVVRASCDVNSDGTPDLVTGALTGGGPHVRVGTFVNGVPVELAGFFAYDPAFNGGVTIACADVTGDGVPEIVTGAGPGGGAHVRVWTLTPGGFVELVGFFAYDQGFNGGLAVAANDINGDGIADIVTGALAGGGAHTRVWTLAGGRLREIAGVMAFTTLFEGGISVASADVTGDGLADIVVGTGPGELPVVRVFSYDSGALQQMRTFLAYGEEFKGGVRVAAADLTGDGIAEVVTGAGPGGAPHVRIFGLTDRSTSAALIDEFFAYDSDFRGGVTVAATAFNGEYAEIITGPGAGGGPHVRLWRVIGRAVDQSGFFAYNSEFTGGVTVATGNQPAGQIPVTNGGQTPLPPSPSPAPANLLLNPGESQRSANGRYVFIYQTDGNLVHYESSGRALWSSGTNGSSAGVTVMQGDGNLVVYDAAGSAAWSSGTEGNPGARLVVQDDGRVVIYSSGGSAIWATPAVSLNGIAPAPAQTPAPVPAAAPSPARLGGSGSMNPGATINANGSVVSSDGRYLLVYQADGNLVLYDEGGAALWSSGTAGTSPGVAAMQGDGNLVIYDAANNPVWASGTSGYSSARLAVQNDGNLVIYESGGAPIWSTNTTR